MQGEDQRIFLNRGEEWRGSREEVTLDRKQGGETTRQRERFHNKSRVILKVVINCTI